MSEIYFVRHGQAFLLAKNYDQLSDQGWQQARWLGEYFRERGISFDRVIVGDMRRHRETLQGLSETMGQTWEADVDARFNEFTFRPVMALYQRLNNPEAEPPKTAQQFFWNVARGHGGLDCRGAGRSAARAGSSPRGENGKLDGV